MIRYEVEVQGHVQGVGFRAFVSETAKSYHVTGTVQNKADGNVEIHVQGDEGELKHFLDRVNQGNTFSSVSNLSKKEVEQEGNETGFKIVY